MPVDYSVDNDLPDDKKKIAGTVLEKLYGSQLFNDLLQDVKTTIQFTDKTREGVHGDYTPSTNVLRVNPTASSADNTLNTVVHELTHAAQYQSPGYFSVGEYPRRKTTGDLKNTADKTELNYGVGELEAFLAANLRPGMKILDSDIKKLLEKNPEETKALYSKTVQPTRNPVNHVKGYPELTATEKVLTTLFGTQFNAK